MIDMIKITKQEIKNIISYYLPDNIPKDVINKLINSLYAEFRFQASEQPSKIELDDIYVDDVKESINAFKNNDIDEDDCFIFLMKDLNNGINRINDTNKVIKTKGVIRNE